MYDFFKMGLAVGSTRVPWWQETDVLLDFDQTRTSLVFEWNISGFCCLFEDWIIVSEKENNLIHQHNCDKRSLSFVCITSKSVTLWFIQSVCVFFFFFTVLHLCLQSVWFVMPLVVWNLWMNLLSVRLSFNQTGLRSNIVSLVSVWTLMYTVNEKKIFSADQRGSILLTLYSVNWILSNLTWFNALFLLL